MTEAGAKHAQAKGALEQELAQRDPELETLEALNRRIGELDEAVRSYETKKGELAEAYSQAVVNRKRKDSCP